MIQCSLNRVLLTTLYSTSNLPDIKSTNILLRIHGYIRHLPETYYVADSLFRGPRRLVAAAFTVLLLQLSPSCCCGSHRLILWLRLSPSYFDCTAFAVFRLCSESI